MGTTAAEPLLLDTSVLLEASNTARRQHRAAFELIERHPRLVFPAQVVREFLVVATRPPDANGLGLTVQEALESLSGFRKNIRLLPETKPLLPTLLRLVEQIKTAGKRIHDANIVAAAVVHRVKRIVTLNVMDFSPFAGHAKVIDPAEARADT